MEHFNDHLKAVRKIFVTTPYRPVRGCPEIKITCVSLVYWGYVCFLSLHSWLRWQRRPDWKSAIRCSEFALLFPWKCVKLSFRANKFLKYSVLLRKFADHLCVPLPQKGWAQWSGRFTMLHLPLLISPLSLFSSNKFFCRYDTVKVFGKYFEIIQHQ